MVEPGKSYSVAEAAELLGKFPKAKFDESIEIAFKMTIDPRKTDQMIRGTVRLPHGSGKEVKVLNRVFKSVRIPIDEVAAVRIVQGSWAQKPSNVVDGKLYWGVAVGAGKNRWSFQRGYKDTAVVYIETTKGFFSNYRVSLINLDDFLADNAPNAEGEDPGPKPRSVGIRM